MKDFVNVISKGSTDHTAIPEESCFFLVNYPKFEKDLAGAG